MGHEQFQTFVFGNKLRLHSCGVKGGFQSLTVIQFYFGVVDFRDIETCYTPPVKACGDAFNLVEITHCYRDALGHEEVCRDIAVAVITKIGYDSERIGHSSTAKHIPHLLFNLRKTYEGTVAVDSFLVILFHAYLHRYTVGDDGQCGRTGYFYLRPVCAFCPCGYGR